LKYGTGEVRKKISWSDRVRNGDLHKVKEETNILLTAKRRKTRRIGHILHRNCLLKRFVKGGIEGRVQSL
jgi:hypothetical protein